MKIKIWHSFINMTSFNTDEGSNQRVSLKKYLILSLFMYYVQNVEHFLI